MTFQTIGRLERLHDFREAELFYNSVTPIRGRAVDVRPLGARRDADKYQIVKCGNEIMGVEYHAVLYRTGCIRFLQNGEIVISTGGYNTALTMAFIAEVLGIGASRQRGTNVFRISGENYITKGAEEVRIKHIGMGAFDIISENKHFQYVINRTGANNVRRRSADFRGYLRGFVSLRTQEVTLYYHKQNVVCIPASEFRGIFGIMGRPDWHDKVVQFVDNTKWVSLTQKQHAYEEFLKSSSYLDSLVTSGDTSKYYEAAMILAGATSATPHMRADSDNMMHMTPDALEDKLDESQFKLYSKDVFTLVELPQGKVPNPKYDSWVDATPSDSVYGKTKA
jgi:hypothetical protein